MSTYAVPNRKVLPDCCKVCCNVLPKKVDLLKNSGTWVDRRDVTAFVKLGGQIEVSLGQRSYLDQRKSEARGSGDVNRG